MNLAHDLFLLLVNLSQLRDREQTLRLFLESMQALFSPAEFQYREKREGQAGCLFEIRTGRSASGFIQVLKAEALPRDAAVMIGNAVQMLALILERLDFDRQLECERDLFAQVAAERLAALEKTIADLEAARRAAINLIQDLTEENEKRKEAESALSDSLALLRIAGRTAGFGGWSVNVRERRVVWSEEVALIHEKEPGYSPTVEEAVAYYAPEWRDRIAAVFQACLQDGVPYDEEMEIVTASGKRRWVRTTGEPVRDEAGVITGGQGAFQDISDRKKSELALKTLSARQEALLGSLPDIVMEVNNAKVYTWANQPGLEFFGDDVVGREAAFYFEGAQETYQVVKPLFGGDESVVHVESWQRRRDGRKRLLSWWCRVLKDDQGNVTGALSSARDITEATEAKAALRASEESLRLALDAANAGIWEWDLATNGNVWSDEIWRLYGLDPQADQASYEAWRRSIHPDDRAAVDAKVAEAVRNGSEISAEWRAATADGSLRWLMSRGRPQRNAEGKLLSYRGIVIDITDRKLAEAAVFASLEEKTALLKEVHHRVKNNLQIVVSLLNLQADRIHNPEVLEALSDTRNRVRSMALLHETLYHSNNLARIYMPDYVESVCAYLLCASGPGTARIQIDRRVEAISLAMDQAVPCGLIISELVTNALKHGFPEGRNGSVQVGLGNLDGQRLELSVTDNGAGLPPGLDPQNTESLGLKLVFMLTHQLRGEMRVCQEGGVSFRITFPNHPGPE